MNCCLDCNCCHDALMMFMNLNIGILSMRRVAYRFIINRIGKSEAIN